MTYLGQAFEMEPPPAAMLEELPAKERPAAAKAWECAQVAGYLDQQNYPAERAEHLAYVRAELERVTKGRPGTSMVCSAAVPPAECVRRLREEIDRATCKGISIPMGPPGFSVCVPRWLIWGGAAVVGLLVIGAVRR